MPFLCFSCGAKAIDDETQRPPVVVQPKTEPSVSTTARIVDEDLGICLSPAAVTRIIQAERQAQAQLEDARILKKSPGKHGRPRSIFFTPK